MNPRCLLATTLLFAVTALSQQSPSAKTEPSVIKVDSPASLIHLGSLDSFDITSGGTRAAEQVLKFIETGDKAAARRALDIYDRIIPDENFGGEYTALKWIVECLLEPEATRKEKFMSDPQVEGFYLMLSDDKWAPLRAYLRDKYHLGDEKVDSKNFLDFTQIKRRNRYLEDFILFANPARESWEKTSKMIAALGIKPGMKIADIGSGPGYFSFKFAQLVGEKGKVYAVDNNEDHVGYLKHTIERLKVKNVESVMPKQDDAGIPERVDLIYMCSLYHNFYAILSDEERDALIHSMRRSLVEGGQLVVVDNGPVAGTLPYHGPFINRAFIIAQLTHQGFELVKQEQFIPQRYMLFFKLKPGEGNPPKRAREPLPAKIPEGGLIAHSLRELPPTPNVAEFVEGDATQIRALSHRSLLRTLITGTSPTYSTKGRTVARKFYDALLKMDKPALAEIGKTYGDLIQRERVGDEYTALQWFCDYITSSDEQKKKFVTGPLVADYVDFFTGNNYERLKKYIKNKYVLGDIEKSMNEMLTKSLDDDKPSADGGKNTAKAATQGQESKSDTNLPKRPKPPTAEEREAESIRLEEMGIQPPPPPYQTLKLDVEISDLIAWWEYLAYSNPRREEWEKTSKMLGFLDIKPGQTVADVGSGGGYYTFKFADLVGEKGKVYALDLVDEQLANLRRGAEKAGYKNISTIKSKENDCMLPENSLDVAYLCSLYHATYVTSIEYVKDGFVDSMKKALKPGGHLVIVDNQPLSDLSGGYYGPRIAKEMIIAQMVKYGLKFKSFAQFVPQRYVLVFEVEK
ncbi:MAG: methyltransferase domain-containing protein [Verrucomicrobiaceae bacterium]|nr:methyltransferase domain-containing protein [Verrucomicrobiaceae bacterium]